MYSTNELRQKPKFDYISRSAILRSSVKYNFGTKRCYN